MIWFTDSICSSYSWGRSIVGIGAYASVPPSAKFTFIITRKRPEHSHLGQIDHDLGHLLL